MNLQTVFPGSNADSEVRITAVLGYIACFLGARHYNCGKPPWRLLGSLSQRWENRDTEGCSWEVAAGSKSKSSS